MTGVCDFKQEIAEPGVCCEQEHERISFQATCTMTQVHTRMGDQCMAVDTFELCVMCTIVSAVHDSTLIQHLWAMLVDAASLLAL